MTPRSPVSDLARMEFLQRFGPSDVAKVSIYPLIRSSTLYFLQNHNQNPVEGTPPNRLIHGALSWWQGANHGSNHGWIGLPPRPGRPNLEKSSKQQPKPSGHPGVLQPASSLPPACLQPASSLPPACLQAASSLPPVWPKRCKSYNCARAHIFSAHFFQPEFSSACHQRMSSTQSSRCTPFKPIHQTPV